jgi:DNA-binding response OmpR family regulator
MRIGVLEDDPDQVAIYRLLFSSAQHQCDTFGTISAFLEGLRNERFDLLVIDWMLPDGTGEEVIRWIRKNIGWNIPVICITARSNEADVVSILQMGADDYFVKSDKHFELLARIGALARRSKKVLSDNLLFGPYEIHLDSREISVAGNKIALTQKDFELATYLFKNPNRLMSREHLLDKIWGIQADIDTRTVDTHISRLRRKLDISPKNGCEIVTVYGYGYRLQHAGAMAPPG